MRTKWKLISCLGGCNWIVLMPGEVKSKTEERTKPKGTPALSLKNYP